MESISSHHQSIQIKGMGVVETQRLARELSAFVSQAIGNALPPDSVHFEITGEGTDFSVSVEENQMAQVKAAVNLFTEKFNENLKRLPGKGLTVVGSKEPALPHPAQA